MYKQERLKIKCILIHTKKGKPNWPYRNSINDWWGSHRMDCPKNDYSPKGKPLFQIVDELAADNEVWAEHFLDGWQQMTSNGYTEADLRDGPENGWFGHFSLTQQGKNIDGGFEKYIASNLPVKFTDPKVQS